MQRVLLLLIAVLILSACSQLSPPSPTPEITQELLPSPTHEATATYTDAATLTLAPTETPEASPLPTQTIITESAPPPSDATQFPDSGQFTWRPVLSGLTRPVGITHAGDGSGRLFVIEQGGVIYVLPPGSSETMPFLDIRDRVNSSANEQGLLGLDFHPDTPQNGYFYVNYTGAGGSTFISRFQVSSDDPNRADPDSETILLRIEQPYGNHNGGMVAFGPDGYLYLGLGDGGSAGDPQNNAQSLATLLGKILRIDVDGAWDGYTIPGDNPFASSESPEIWALGLRNPWRFSFDRLTGDLYIGDVGQNQWEEIDYLSNDSPGGANFGWNYYEGSQPYTGTPPQDVTLIPPIAEYSHDQGCSVTGGVVYRGDALPEWQGIYLYGDYCSGRMWGLLKDQAGNWVRQPIFENLGRIVSFGESEIGEVYLVTHEGIIYTLDRK